LLSLSLFVITLDDIRYEPKRKHVGAAGLKEIIFFVFDDVKHSQEC